MSLTKEEREREVFRLYATVAGLLANGSFESRTPSEPDILYVPTIGPCLAFELVEILDQDYSSSIGRQLKTKDECIQYLNSLPPSARSAFNTAFGDADICIEFKATLSLQRRRNALPLIFEQLILLPPGTTGQVLNNAESLDAVLDHVSVHRGRFRGPLFDDPSAVWVGDPTVDAIKSKMARPYKPCGQLNLLAYIDGNPMFPDDVWIPALNQYLATLDTSCQFSHLYVFECKSNSIRRAWHRDA